MSVSAEPSKEMGFWHFMAIEIKIQKLAYVYAWVGLGSLEFFVSVK